MVYTKLLFHDLRRSFITAAEHGGAPRHEAMQISVHKTEAVLHRYAITNRVQRRAALETIEQFRAEQNGAISGTTEGSPEQGSSAIH